MTRRLVSAWLLLPAVACVLCSHLAFAAAKPNVILVTLGSIRADRMSFLGSNLNLTPNLSTLAKQSLIFEQAYAQAPLTVTSHATILSGTYSQTHRMNEFGGSFPAGLPFLPDLLRSKGYRTGAIVSSSELDPQTGLTQGLERGFETYEVVLPQPKTGAGRSESRAQLIARVTAWILRNKQGPFFLWLQVDGPKALSADSYNPGLSAADMALGKLFTALRANNLYEDALIVITADHGEGLGEHGERGHGVFLYDETIHVPLLLKLPQGHNSGKRVHTKVRLVDVAPSILEIAALEVPSQMEGQSLMRIARSPSPSDQPVYSRTDFPQSAFGWSMLESWRAGKYLYIRAPKPELYDLSADPAATRNLASTSKGLLDTIAAQLNAFDQHFSELGRKSPGTELSSSEMQKLASLGYVGLQKPAIATAAGVIGVDPKDGISTANKVLSAVGLLHEAKPARASAILQDLVSQDAGMYLAQYVLGVSLARQRQYLPAIEHLHKAIELQPQSGHAHFEMGGALLQVANYKAAAVHLEIASERMPGSADPHSLLAQAYDHLGRTADAGRERAAAAQIRASKP